MSGGELFYRICARGAYYERDAAKIVATVLSAVEYLHSVGIVHRGMYPAGSKFDSSSAEHVNRFETRKLVVQNPRRRFGSLHC